MEHTPSWEADSSSASQEIPRILWEPEGSLPHSREPATRPCPESDQSIPCLQHTSWRSTLILYSPLRVGLLGKFFPSGFPIKLTTNLLSLLHMLNLRDPYPNHLISSWSEWVESMEKGLPCAAIFLKASQFTLTLCFRHPFYIHVMTFRPIAIRVPRGARFSTVCGVYSASCSMGNGFWFPVGAYRTFCILHVQSLVKLTLACEIILTSTSKFKIYHT